MQRQPEAAAELVAILDKFLEAADRARTKGVQNTYARRYKTLIAKRFKAQRDWFLDHALPHLKHRPTESQRNSNRTPFLQSLYKRLVKEASSDDEAVAETISALMDQWLEDPELQKQIDQLVKLAQAAGVDALSGQMTAAEFAAALLAIQANAGIAYKFGLDNPRAIQWLKDHAFENVADSIDATSQSILKNILVTALEEKKSYSQMASEIRAKFNDWSRSRAETIATYEIGNAYTQGTLSAATDMQERADIDMEKAWLTAQDDLVSDDCEANEEAGWIDLDEDFPSGDEAPLAHPNCRCALQVRTVKSQELVSA